MYAGKATAVLQSEATPLSSRPYLLCDGAVPQYLRFNEIVADSQQFRGANPKYWVTAMPGGIFLRYGLSKRVVPSSYEPLWGLSKAASYGPGFFT